jgi:hypothetical protein
MNPEIDTQIIFINTEDIIKYSKLYTIIDRLILQNGK